MAHGRDMVAHCMDMMAPWWTDGSKWQDVVGSLLICVSPMLECNGTCSVLNMAFIVGTWSALSSCRSSLLAHWLSAFDHDDTIGGSGFSEASTRQAWGKSYLEIPSRLAREKKFGVASCYSKWAGLPVETAQCVISTTFRSSRQRQRTRNRFPGLFKSNALDSHSIGIRCCMYILYIKNISFFTVHVECSRYKKCSLDKQSISFVARSKGKCFLEKYYSW